MDKTELQMSAEKQQRDEHQGLKIVQGPILAPAQVGPKGNGCHGSDGWTWEQEDAWERSAISETSTASLGIMNSPHKQALNVLAPGMVHSKPRNHI